MADVWQTIEQAAVTLGLSVRTVNRHITAGKLESRLFEGRREVLIPADLRAADGDGRGLGSTVPATEPNFTFRSNVEASGSRRESVNADATRSQDRAGTYPIGGPTGSGGTGANDPVWSAESAGREGDRQRVTPEIAGERPWDVQTMLALTDSIDDKATLAVAAYQTLARSAETQVQSLRKVAFGAWGVVGVMAVGITIAVGWAAVAITSAEKSAGYLQEQLQKSNAKTQELEQTAKEYQAAREELFKMQGEARALQQARQDNQREQGDVAERAAAAALRQVGLGTRPVGTAPPVGSASPLVRGSGGAAGSPAAVGAPVGSPTTQPTYDSRAIQAAGSVPGSRPASFPAGRSAAFPGSNPPYMTNSNATFDPK